MGKKRAFNEPSNSDDLFDSLKQVADDIVRYTGPVWELALAAPSLCRKNCNGVGKHGVGNQQNLTKDQNYES